MSYRPQYLKMATDAVSNIAEIYFCVDYLSKRKNIFAQLCDFCDQDCCKILKHLNVCCLGMSIFVERVIKRFPVLQSYCLFSITNERDGTKSTPRKYRPIAAFKHPLVRVMLSFLHAALQPLINLTFLLKGSGPLTNSLYGAFIYLCQVTFE